MADRFGEREAISYYDRDAFNLHRLANQTDLNDCHFRREKRGIVVIIQTMLGADQATGADVRLKPEAVHTALGNIFPRVEQVEI